MTVEELQVLVTARTQGLQSQMNNLTRQLQGVQRQSNSMGNNMTNMFKNLKRTLIGLGIGKAIKSMFDMSRTYEAATQQVNRIFRENASAIEAWIQKNATTFGMARADAMEYASIYGNLVKGFEKDTSKMSQYTTQLLEATTVIASNTGRTVQDVSERIRSGLLGNTEAIEDLGIYANVAMIKTTNAFKTIANGRTWEQLAYQEQQQIRLMSIIEQSSAQFGTSIQQNTNYQLMQLTANLKNIALNLGNAFMPIVSVVLPCLNSMALALANVTNKLASFMNALFGTNFGTGAGEVQQVATGAGDAAQGYSDMADSADDAGESAKKAGKAAKNALMGFDEVNQLAKDTGGGTGEGGGTGAITNPGTEVNTVMSEAAESFADKVAGTMDRLKNLFTEGFEIGLGDGWQAQIDDIIKSVQGIKDSLIDIFTDNDVINAAKNYVDSLALFYGKMAGSAVSIGTTIAQNLFGGINKYLDQNKQYIKDRLVGILNVSADIVNLSGDFAVAFADIFSVFGRDTAQQITANIIGMFTNGFLGAAELALKFGRDIIKCIVEPITNNTDKIKTALENTLKPLEGITGTISKGVTDFFSGAIDVYDKHIAPMFDKISQGLSDVFGTLLDAYNTYIAPVLQKISEEFGKIYESTIKPVMDNILSVVGKLADCIGVLWENVIVPIAEWLINTLAPVVASVVDIVWGYIKMVIDNFSNAINDITTIIGGIIDFITGVFSGDWDKAWQGIQDIVSGVGQLIYDSTIGVLENIIKFVSESFVTSWEGAVESIKNFFAPIVDWFDTNVVQPVAKFFSGLWDGICKATDGCWQGICNIWNTACNWFNDTVINPIRMKFAQWVTAISKLCSDAWDGLVGAWQGACSWFTNTIINPIKKAFSTCWNGVKTTAENAFNGLVRIVKAPINIIIDGLNCLINGLNKFKIDIPDWVSNIPGLGSYGGQIIGFNIPKIPRLARGGIVDGATYFGNYIAGEAGKEMIVPLENTAFTDKIASAMGQAVMNAMALMINHNSDSGQQAQNVSLEWDGVVFARTATPYIIKEMKRLGIDI